MAEIIAISVSKRTPCYEKPDGLFILKMGLVKNSVSGVLGPLSSSHTPCTLGLPSPCGLPEERHVLACTGWAGETEGFF